MIAAVPTEVLVTHREPLTAMGILGTLALDDAFSARLDQADHGAGSTAPGAPIVVTDYDEAMALMRQRSRKAAAATAGIRVVVVSARDTEFEVREALQSGVRGYMTMNCARETLLEGMHAVARGGRFVSKDASERLLSSLERTTLTRREGEVLELIAVGHPDKRIAAMLNVAPGTVKTHAKAILGKLGVASRTEAAFVARERGMLA